MWAGDLLQVPRPEQPILAVGQAHVYGYVLFSPVKGHDLTHKASALFYPVVLGDPHLRTWSRLFKCHALGARFPLLSTQRALHERVVVRSLFLAFQALHVAL